MARVLLVAGGAAAVVVLAAGTFAACGATPKPVDVTAFDQRCTKNDDCATVPAGDACGHCVCDAAAVAQAEAPRVRALFDERRAQCHLERGWACEPCLAQIAVCRASRCEIIPLPVPDAGP